MANEKTQLKEIIELREVNKKVFLMSDGSYKEIYYPMAVHIFDEDTNTYIDLPESLISESEEIIDETESQSGIAISFSNNSSDTRGFDIIVGNIYSEESTTVSEPEIQINLTNFINKRYTVKRVVLNLNGGPLGEITIPQKVSLFETFFEENKDYSILSAENVEYDITNCMLTALKLGHDCLNLKLTIGEINRPDSETTEILSGYNVTLYVEYETANIIKTSGSLHSHDIGRFGTGYIDLISGNLCFECEDFTWSGNKMPITLKHLYTSALYDTDYTYNTNTFYNIADFSSVKVGKGWRLDIMQSIKKSDDTYIYVDGYGNETILSYDENSSKYENTDVGLIFDEENQTLVVGDDKYEFNNRRLISITDSYDNKMSINYVADKIESITDGAGRVFTFAYNEENYLTSITAPDNTSITYEYISGYLSKITYPDGRYATLLENEEDAENITQYIVLNIKEANGTNIKKMQYEMNGYRIKNIYGDGLNVFYNFYPETKSVNIKISNSDEERNYTYNYDYDGNKTAEYMLIDEDIIEIEASHGLDPYAECTGIVNKAENLIDGHNLFDKSQWSVISGDYNLETLNESYSYFGKNVINLSGDTEDSIGGIGKHITLLNGDYTFSAYIKTLKNYSQGGGAYITIFDGDTADKLCESELIADTKNEYMRISINFSLEAQRNIYIEIMTNGVGSTCFDGLQLEKNSFPTEYNYIDLANSTSFNNGVATVHGNLDSAENKSVPVYVKTAKGTRENFILSGWAKAENNLPCHERENSNLNTFRLRAVINYVKGNDEETAETEEFITDFNPDTNCWQYASLDIEKTKFKEIENIDIYCDYDYNTGTAYFDNLRLVRNSIETDLTEVDFITEETETDDVGVGDSDNPSEETDTETEKIDEVLDKFGNPITETTYTDGEFGAIYRSFGYNTEFDENLAYNKEKSGNDLTYETDNRGNATLYAVDLVHSRNDKIIDRLGNSTAFEYDANGKVTKVTNRDNRRNDLANVSYTYDGLDNLSGIDRGDGMGYSLSYNNFSQLLNIGIKGIETPLVSYFYKKTGGKLGQVQYANGDRMEATYNSFGQLVAEKWYDKDDAQTAYYKYAYDGEGNIIRSIDILSQLEYNYLYSEGNLVSAKEYSITLSDEEFVTGKTLLNETRLFYDNEGNLTKKAVTFEDGTEQITNFEQPEEGNQIVRFEADGLTVSTLSKTDHLGRKVFDEIQTSVANVSRRFEYTVGNATRDHILNEKVKSLPTTQLVSKITFADGRTIEYEYDKEERITKIIDSLDGETDYTYDALGQLLSEYRKKKGEYISKPVNIITYDNYGNIKTKNGVSYVYDDVWKDKIIYAGGKSIVYDEQGNPTNYFGNILTWEKGRQLKSFNLLSFKYNANGIRTSKIVNGIEHKYILEGTKILKETWEDNTLIPLYDNEDSVCGIKYNDTAYFFIKNLQGDVIAIVDKNGNQAARYTYDAWGMHTEFYSDDSNIGFINPFRYRGYYYDSEINLYYLQSRYYDPRGGRFLNADMPEFGMVEQGALTHNLFAYCGNDCVDFVDYIGYAATKIYAFKFTYDRSKAISYAEKWYRSYNKMYYKYSQDCANFVSQCLYAGGVFMTISSDGWYSLRKEQKGFNFKKLLSLFSYKYGYQWDIGPAWRIAEKQYQYFKNSKYANKTFSITSKSDISKKLNEYTIKKGDLMYFDYRGNSNKEHATMISKVTDEEIFYTAHTEARFNKNLKDVFKSKKKLKVYIITIKDSI